MFVWSTKPRKISLFRYLVYINIICSDRKHIRYFSHRMIDCVQQTQLFQQVVIKVSASYSSKGVSRASASWSVDGTSDKCWRNGRPWMQVRLFSPSCCSILCTVSSTSSLDKFVGNWRASRTASPCEGKVTIQVFEDLESLKILLCVWLNSRITILKPRKRLNSWIYEFDCLPVEASSLHVTILDQDWLPKQFAVSQIMMVGLVFRSAHRNFTFWANERENNVAVRRREAESGATRSKRRHAPSQFATFLTCR